MVNDYDESLRETECAPPIPDEEYSEPFRFAEGVLFGSLISSAAWAALMIWAIL